ncbi:hypothetical protein ACFSHQ_00630 [Gemmobacter lanyuensis]
MQLLGPVARVTALTATPQSSRTIGNGPRLGEEVPVRTPTTIHALLQFASGAVITLVASWDVWQHDLANMALYGSEGTLHVPDPNFFDGPVRMTHRGEAADLPAWDHPLGPKTGTKSGAASQITAPPGWPTWRWPFPRAAPTAATMPSPCMWSR